MQEEGGDGSLSKRGAAGRAVCLGDGCECSSSPSNQLELQAETAWLGSAQGALPDLW